MHGTHLLPPPPPLVRSHSCRQVFPPSLIWLSLAGNPRLPLDDDAWRDRVWDALPRLVEFDDEVADASPGAGDGPVDSGGGAAADRLDAPPAASASDLNLPGRKTGTRGVVTCACRAGATQFFFFFVFCFWTGLVFCPDTSKTTDLTHRPTQGRMRRQRRRVWSARPWPTSATPPRR